MRHIPVIKFSQAEKPVLPLRIITPAKKKLQLDKDVDTLLKDSDVHGGDRKELTAGFCPVLR
jgi:hypothetical protein